MENLDMGGPPLLALIMLLLVNPFARDAAKMLGAVMAVIAGMIFLSPAFLVWKFSTLLSEYHRQAQAEEMEKKWAYACSQHVYRNAFKPTTPVVDKLKSDQVSPPLVIAFFIAALVVGIHFGSNT